MTSRVCAFVKSQIDVDAFCVTGLNKHHRIWVFTGQSLGQISLPYSGKGDLRRQGGRRGGLQACGRLVGRDCNVYGFRSPIDVGVPEANGSTVNPAVLRYARNIARACSGQRLSVSYVQ